MNANESIVGMDSVFAVEPSILDEYENPLATLNVADVRRRAEAGSSRYQLLLGYLYKDGSFGVPQDYEQAFRWYKAAADPGDVNFSYANYQTGMAYKMGHGVPQSMRDTVSAWRVAAAEQEPHAMVQMA